MWKYMLGLVLLMCAEFLLVRCADSAVNPSESPVQQQADNPDIGHGDTGVNSHGATAGGTSHYVCNNTIHPCNKGIVLPAWKPTVNVPLVDRVFRAIIYLISLIYAFLGSSIISDRFLSAIEVDSFSQLRISLHWFAFSSKFLNFSPKFHIQH